MGMALGRGEPPAWLPGACARVARLHSLELLGRFAPVSPAPSPLKLQAVTEVGDPAHTALQLHGGAQLRMLAAFSLHAEHPADDAGLLARRVAAITGPARCAALLLASDLPNGAGVAPSSEQAAASSVEALIGAYSLEFGGDPYATCKCWEWLAGDDELAGSLMFVASTAPKWQGRTPTYQYFRETEVDGAPTLEVYFPGKGTVLYQRPVVETGGAGTEKMADAPAAMWLGIDFDPVLGTFVSGSMLQENNTRMALPNKVWRWLRGDSMQKLVTLKHYKERTERYEGLRETLDGWLEVRYVDKGVYRYRRSDAGNIGLEEASGALRPQPLFYSELFKTLRSPEGHLVPNKVVEWLQGKGLTQLVSQTRAPRGDEQVQVVHDDVDSITWAPGLEQPISAPRMTCRACVVGGTTVFTMQLGVEGVPREIEFCEDSKAWAGPGGGSLCPPRCLSGCRQRIAGMLICALACSTGSALATPGARSHCTPTRSSPPRWAIDWLKWSRRWATSS